MRYFNALRFYITAEAFTGLSDSAKTFLDSIERNSIKTRKAYASALKYFMLFLQGRKHTLQSIIKPLSTNKINVYELLDSFVGYLISITSEETHRTLTNGSILLYVTAVRSYLAYYDIDIIPYKFKRKVHVPKVAKQEEQAIDASDIRKILLACNNKRLKVYLLVLASGGPRVGEACSIRLGDINFDTNPTTIHIRKETKTKVARDIYISDEATNYVKQWIDWKYRNHKQSKTDLLFTTKTDTSGKINALYTKLLKYFNMVLAAASMDERKEDELRRKITMHSFRRYVKTVAADQVNSDYSEWLIGHSHSTYYSKKEDARRELYVTKCMKYLTFLDYSLLKTMSKNIEDKFAEKDNQIKTLQNQVKEIESIMSDEEGYRAHLEDEIKEMMEEIRAKRKH